LAGAEPENNHNVIGFINGTCVNGSEILHESMFTHEVHGTTLVIHSVVVAKEYRRSGYGSHMLNLYLKYIADHCLNVKRILLLSKAELLRFYVKSGFSVIGLSSVHHGKVLNKVKIAVMKSVAGEVV